MITSRTFPYTSCYCPVCPLPPSPWLQLNLTVSVVFLPFPLFPSSPANHFFRSPAIAYFVPFPSFRPSPWRPFFYEETSICIACFLHCFWLSLGSLAHYPCHAFRPSQPCTYRNEAVLSQAKYDPWCRFSTFSGFIKWKRSPDAECSLFLDVRLFLESLSGCLGHVQRIPPRCLFFALIEIFSLSFRLSLSQFQFFR